jgi:methionyl-tRNA formyltransferase
MHSFDIGPILMQQSFPLSTNITMFELLKMSADIGCSLVNINPECLKIALWLLF